MYDGSVYEALLERVKSEPLNREDVVDGYAVGTEPVKIPLRSDSRTSRSTSNRYWSAAVVWRAEAGRNCSCYGSARIVVST